MKKTNVQLIKTFNTINSELSKINSHNINAEKYTSEATEEIANTRYAFGAAVVSLALTAVFAACASLDYGSVMTSGFTRMMVVMGCLSAMLCASGISFVIKAMSLLNKSNFERTMSQNTELNSKELFAIVPKDCLNPDTIGYFCKLANEGKVTTLEQAIGEWEDMAG